MNRVGRHLTRSIFLAALVAGGIYLGTRPAPENSTPEVKEAPESSLSRPANREEIPEKSEGTPGDGKLESLLKSARNSLPDRNIFKGRSDESFHDTPPEVLEAGNRFAALAEYLESHPDAIPEALPLYGECALDEKTVASLRALCAYRLEHYREHWNDTTRADYEKIPSRIRELAARLR